MSSAVAQPPQPPRQYQEYGEPAHRIEHVQQSPELTSSPASARRQGINNNGAPPNTPASSIPYSPGHSNTAMSTPRAQQATSARQTPASRSSAAQQDPYYSGRSEASLPYRPSQGQGSSPYSERQDSARTSVPFNTPELASGFDLDRSRENAGSTPGAGQNKREKKDTRIFSEPQPARQHAERTSRQPAASRSAGALTQQAPPASREDSTVINRLVVSDMQEDAAREQARIAESRPAPEAANATPITGLGLVGSEGVEDGGRGGQQAQPQQRSRQEHLKNNQQPRRETKFGDYILGQTIGEGEFGKVKMGWKKDGGVQVAIKLIRRESLGNNPNRLPKIYREIAILRGLQHPNIVRLHEMVETERHIGIILEYASGGELFDYILNHRYLKDSAARRLFAQLVSGVGYLHKKGIVHRDLKLENLLLDRNKNIIITDFGFANTFSPDDELGEEIEYNLSNRDFVQRMNLEQIRADGHRRGDLMQTSCGSPCYAAPELVVSDSLYTGRKVDVWSCGVILYAMLAGYLPFDDDPANPEGDNINLLYKYIVSTPLTFPEYVTPHARDLLRRILVPDPRKRADLFEVARHSWLNEYAHVVSFITSTTTTTADLNAMATAEPLEGALSPGLGRSASVREPTKPSPMVAQGKSPAIASAEERQKKDRDAKRRTVQVEYVAPQSQTQRGEAPQIPSNYTTATAASQSRVKARQASEDKALPEAPAASSSNQRPVTLNAMGPPSRSRGADVPRAVSDSTAFVSSPVPSSNGRPSTRGSVSGAATGTARLPSRGNSYGQPAAATVAPTNVEGRFSQPQRNSMILSGPLENEMSGRDPATGRPMSQQFPVGYQPRLAGEPKGAGKGHRRTSTVESFTAKIFGRSNSTRKQSMQQDAPSPRPERKNRQYPPVSMNNVMPSGDPEMQSAAPRRSTESRRSSINFLRRESTNQDPNKRASKRFSFLPTAFSRMSLTGNSREDVPQKGKEEGSSSTKRNSSLFSQPPPSRSRHDSKFLSGLQFGGSPSQSVEDARTPEGEYSSYSEGRQQLPSRSGPQRGATAPDLNFSTGATYSPSGGYRQPQQSQNLGVNYDSPSQSAEEVDMHPNFAPNPTKPLYPAGFNDGDGQGLSPRQRQQQEMRRPLTAGREGKERQTLQKPQRRFEEGAQGQGGSSSGARRVMNWFRSRGRERAS